MFTLPFRISMEEFDQGDLWYLLDMIRPKDGTPNVACTLRFGMVGDWQFYKKELIDTEHNRGFRIAGGKVVGGKYSSAMMTVLEKEYLEVAVDTVWNDLMFLKEFGEVSYLEH
jgi:hypothetical protein